MLAAYSCARSGTSRFSQSFLGGRGVPLERADTQSAALIRAALVRAGGTPPPPSLCGLAEWLWFGAVCVGAVAALAGLGGATGGDSFDLAAWVFDPDG